MGRSQGAPSRLADGFATYARGGRSVALPGMLCGRAMTGLLEQPGDGHQTFRVVDFRIPES
jgi:hypothetical protein